MIDNEKLQIIKKTAKGRGMKAIIAEVEKKHDLPEKEYLWKIHQNAYKTGKKKSLGRMRIDFRHNYKWIQKVVS